MGLEINGTFGANCAPRIQDTKSTTTNNSTSPIEMSTPQSSETTTQISTEALVANTASALQQNSNMPDAATQVLAGYTEDFNRAYADGNPDAYDTNNGFMGSVYDAGYQVHDMVYGAPTSNFPIGSEAAA